MIELPPRTQNNDFRWYIPKNRPASKIPNEVRQSSSITSKTTLSNYLQNEVRYLPSITSKTNLSIRCFWSPSKHLQSNHLTPLKHLQNHLTPRMMFLDWKSDVFCLKHVTLVRDSKGDLHTSQLKLIVCWKICTRPIENLHFSMVHRRCQISRPRPQHHPLTNKPKM